MPQQIKMVLFNGNLSPEHLKLLYKSTPLPSLPKLTTLNSPMISRVHNQKAGCSSCSRH
jgi:hypothetical protein